MEREKYSASIRLLTTTFGELTFSNIVKPSVGVKGFTSVAIPTDTSSKHALMAAIC